MKPQTKAAPKIKPTTKGKQISPFPEEIKDADWQKVSPVLLPVILADEVSKLLLRFDLRDHPECRKLYAAVAEFTLAQGQAVPAKQAAIRALKREAMKAHRAAQQVAA